jgi:hypothetical protein
MKTETGTARTCAHAGAADAAAILRETGPALDAARADVDGWERCVLQVADRYRVQVNRDGGTGRYRYVAVARHLGVRPYAVVTGDPAELLRALGCPDMPATPHGRRADW